MPLTTPPGTGRADRQAVHPAKLSGENARFGTTVMATAALSNRKHPLMSWTRR